MAANVTYLLSVGTLQVYEHAHKLTCQYRRHHPMFYINPLREEVMYLDPRIVIYHNLITDAEIAKVKELAKPRVSTPVQRLSSFAYNYKCNFQGGLHSVLITVMPRLSAYFGSQYFWLDKQIVQISETPYFRPCYNYQ